MFCVSTIKTKAMAGKFVAKVNVLFGANIKQFSTKMQNVSRQLAKTGKQMQKVGKSMSMVTAAITAAAAGSVYAWDKQAQSIAQVEAGLKSTGGTVGRTSAELQQMASQLQNITRFGDEDILKGVTSQLLTFTNITTEQFDRTQMAALDLATRLDGDLKSASIQLGKALNDPIANLSALSRSGIQFSDSQKVLIKSLWETGKQAEAQTLILDELEKQYGGSAEAAAKAGAGPLVQLSNSLGDLSEEFGRIIMDYIRPFVEWLKNLVDGFQGMDESTKRMIVVLSGVVAAIGPILLIGGKILAMAPMISAAFTSISTAMMGITWPIAAIIAAVAALAAAGIYLYDNWDVVTEKVGNLFKSMKNTVVEALASIVEGLGSMIEKLTGSNPFSSTAESLRSMKVEIIDSGKEFGSFGDAISNAAHDAKEALFGVEEQAKKTDFAVKTIGASATIGSGVGGNDTSSVVGDGGIQSSGVDTSVFTTLTDQANIANEALAVPISGMQSKLETLQTVGQTVGQEMSNAFNNMGASLVQSLDLADTGLGRFATGMVQTVTKLIAMFLSQSIATSIAGATTSGAATGPAAVFTTPAFIATAVGGVLSAFAAIPKFADGGIITGPTMGLMGEYAGARTNPEVIAPLDKLKNLIGGNNGDTIHVTGYLKGSGSDLVAVIDEHAYRRNIIG
jgi:hypothetical protein